MLSIVEHLCIISGTAMIALGLIGIVLSPFFIKATDRLFTGESDNINVWFPLCFWGMSQYAWHLLLFKKDKFEAEYPVYLEKTKSSKPKYTIIKGLLFTVYMPANIALVITAILYALRVFL
ncbi:hypothetical protein [Larsenimonas suaedae]|uniref:DUF4149 domain-containing protein n=1 Tax=Larsenimonas suaedae TaxID=1851019 RepID=A0ABU1GZD3_9GAMM|nr:hypothetical protein [Larsenimonas suaedae]MCM2973485.1 hypothetical protein [Larsenimonas suaedae]MDR5897339.1 hypothetical protein [Larsenimonas suaedae]